MLILFRHMSNLRLVRLAAVLVFVPVLVQLAITASGGATDPGAPLIRQGESVLVATGLAPDALPYPVLKTAGWAEYLRFQVSGPFFRYGELLTEGRPFKVLAMFLLGLWIGRSGLLRAGDAALPLLRRVRLWGLAIGVPASMAHAVLYIAGVERASCGMVAEVLAYALGIVPLAMAYAAAFALAYRQPRWGCFGIR